MFSFTFILLSLVIHLITGIDSVSKCDSGPIKFRDEVKRHNCEWTSTVSLSFKNAQRVCRRFGANIDAFNDGSTFLWYGHVCNIANNKCMRKEKYCPKKSCTIQKGNHCKKVSCSSKYKFKCVREYWHYGADCPKNFFHVGRKCYRVSPVQYLKDLNNSKYNSICKKISGSFRNERLGASVLVALQAYVAKQVSFPVIVDSSAILMGNQSLYPGRRSSKDFLGVPTFAQILCFSERNSFYGESKQEQFGYTGTWSGDNCPRGFYSYNGYSDYCLRLINATKVTTAEHAEQLCKRASKGSHLVSIRNDLEQSIVNIIRLHTEKDIMIGIDRIDDGIITWRDKSHSTYQKYQSYKNDSVGREMCTVMKKSGTWIDVQCNEKSNAFLCAARRKDSRFPSIRKCEGISINDICYFTSNTYCSLAILDSREITEQIGNWLPSQNISKLCVSHNSSYLPWRKDTSTNPYLDINTGWLERGTFDAFLCQYSKEPLPPSTAMPKTTKTPVAKEQQPLGGVVIALIIAIAVILCLFIGAGTIFICCFCNRSNNAPQTLPPPTAQNNDTRVQMELPPRKTPEPLPKDDGQGIFDDEYEEFPDGEKEFVA